MWLTNLEVRVKEYPEGWSVERKKGLRWVHIESVSGIDSDPWYCSTKETAIEEAKKHFEWDLLIGITK